MTTDTRTPQQIAEDRLRDQAERKNNRLWAKISGLSAVGLVLVSIVGTVFWAVTDRAANIEDLGHVKEVQKHVVQKLEEHDKILNENAVKLTEIQSDVKWMSRTMGKPDEPAKPSAK